MRIGICALGAVSQDTGGQTYLKNFAKTLGEIKTNNEFVWFFSKGESKVIEFPDNTSTNVVVELPLSARTVQRLVCEHILLPLFSDHHRVDVMFFPNNYASIFYRKPFVLAIRSMLIYNTKSHGVNLIRSFYRSIIAPLSAKKAAIIITPSYHTKLEIIKHLNISDNNIEVISHGIDIQLFGSEKNSDAADTLWKKWNIKPPFILYVSALWSYKNHDKLILAFDKYRKSKKTDFQLVLIGKGASSFESYGKYLKDLITDLKLSEVVRFIDFLPHQDLKHFYQWASVYAFPSQTESFGNSIYEAMAAGAPIICSNTHGYETKVKEAVLSVNPHDINCFADAINAVINNKNLRANLIKNGKIQANNMSWDNCIRNTVLIIEKANYEKN
ncbi:glycosyltransferase family 4 protein [bacterium]|nr:glycosyltransferase family 4 protein [bacterium]NUN46810.1 glycosyltransferase family 4 protein [bacterium]HNH34126.1 glycosyltransferase family 1 protein [bacterium]